MFKVNNKDTGVILVSLLLTLNMFHTLFSVSIVNFEQVNAGVVGGVNREPEASGLIWFIFSFGGGSLEIENGF